MATSHLTNQDARVFVTPDTTRDIIHKAFFQCTFPSFQSGLSYHSFQTLGNKPGHRSIACSLEVAHDCVLGCSHLNFSPMCRLSTCVRESYVVLNFADEVAISNLRMCKRGRLESLKFSKVFLTTLFLSAIVNEKIE